MPALPDVPGVLRVTYLWNIGSDLSCTSRQYIAYTGTAPTNAVCGAIATAAYSAAAPAYTSYMSSERSIEGVEVVDLTSPVSGVGAHTQHTPGAVAGAGLPAEVCVIVNAQVARRYRGGKPRVYLPLGQPADLLTPQLWQSASVASFQAAHNAATVGVSGTTFSGTVVGSWVSVSYYAGFHNTYDPAFPLIRGKNVSNPRTVPLVDPILSYSVNAKVGSQRRRQQH
jgi:hypothetical protein